MKKIRVLPLILIICLVLGAYTPSAYALDKPRLRSADGVILIDLYTGETLFELEPDTEHSIASLTKVMTCLLAVEAVEQGRVTLSEMIEAQPDCKQGMDTSSSNAGIEPGEIMSYKDYLYCAMVSSANEACIVLATYLEGSVGNFVQKMNARAQELGCQHTHFSDADGMLNRSEGHYSTPRDLSIITREAMKHKLFVEVCSTVDYEVPPTNYRDSFEIHNTNALVSADGLYGDSYLYDGVIGVKTGFTKPAGYCLISTCKRDDKYLLAVVLGCNGVLTYTFAGEYQNFQDSATLYDWGFQNFSYKDIFLAGEPLTRVDIQYAKDNETLALGPDQSIKLLLPNDIISNDLINIDIQLDEDKLVAPIAEGDQLGIAEVYFDGEYYTTVNMLAKTSIEMDKKAARQQKRQEFFHSGWVKGILIGVPVCLGLFIAISAYLKLKRRQQLRTKMEAMERKKRAQTAGQRTTGDEAELARRRAMAAAQRRAQAAQQQRGTEEDELARRRAMAAAQRRAQAAQQQGRTQNPQQKTPQQRPQSPQQRPPQQRPQNPQQRPPQQRPQSPQQRPTQQRPQSPQQKPAQEYDIDEIIRSLGVDFKDI